MSTLTKNMSGEDRKMLNKIFLRSFSVFASCAGGSVKAGADGWLYSVQPALNRYYADDPEKRADAMSRHTTWYNITQNVGTFAMGLVASMERENSQHDDFDSESIDGIKVSLMGPMSGIGDAIFWGVLRVIAAGIGINLAMSGWLAAGRDHVPAHLQHPLDPVPLLHDVSRLPDGHQLHLAAV